MSIFSRCCPKKPKKSLDYVIKWVEETDKTLKEIVAWKEQIEEEDLKTLFDTYAESYPWDQVPVIGTLQGDVSDLQHDLRSLETSVSSLETDVDSRLAARIEKPAECVAGNVPVWTESAGLSGEGRAIEENAPSADGASLITSGAVYTALQGKADSEHSHNIIINQASGGRTALFEVDATSKTARLELNDGTTYKRAEINMNNIDNLNRALTNPDTTPNSESDNLITSGGVASTLNKVNKEVAEKLNIPIDSIYFISNNGSLALDNNQLTKFDEAIFEKVPTSGFTHLYKTLEVNIYNSSEDIYIPFFGMCWASYDIYNNSYTAKISVGEHYIKLVKYNGTISISEQYTISDLLQ